VAEHWLSGLGAAGLAVAEVPEGAGAVEAILHNSSLRSIKTATANSPKKKCPTA
jgi:hypothetical protein